MNFAKTTATLNGETRMRNSNSAIYATAAILVALVATDIPAAAGEIKVMSAIAAKVALDEIIPLYEKASGNKLVAQYDSVAVVAKRAATGEAFDVTISNIRWMDDLVKQGIVLADSETVVGTTVASLAYRRGTPKPDISTPDAMKAVILKANKISLSDPADGGASSVYFVGVIRQLGIYDVFSSKAIPTKAGEGIFPVSDGTADIGVAQASEIALAPGVEGVPIFPSDPKSKSSYVAGVSSRSKEADAARAFIKFMLSPDAVAIRKSKGLAAD
jgi:molybdate transport system substrate-binding protein